MQLCWAGHMCLGSNGRCHCGGLEGSKKKGVLMLRWESPARFAGMLPPVPLLWVGDWPWGTGEGCPGSERAQQSPAIQGGCAPDCSEPSNGTAG